MRTLRSTLGLFALVAGAGAPGFSGTVLARPVPTYYPGGAAPDSLVIELPVRFSPLLIALRSAGPLARATGSQSVDSGRAEAVAPLPADAPPRAAGADALTWGGTKALSVEVGRGRDPALKQALDLSLRGRIAGDVEVEGTLSDQRLPFESDGATRELDDLDRLSLRITAPRAEASMGDFRLENLPGAFLGMCRELEGVRGTARTSHGTMEVAFASAKGERRSAELRGEEGKQGPYALESRATGMEAQGIVAGSETIWLDGAPMRRGADGDYVMNYGAATITFTNRRPITAQSRIAVDYERATGRYRRRFAAASSRGGTPAGIQWFASLIREGDDANDPLAGALSAEDRDALDAAGDSTGQALPSGTRYAGAGGGSYAWDSADPAAPRWIYLGPGRGDYEVEFAPVGPGQGAYADTVALDGTRFFRFVGDRLGSFEPGRFLAAPRAHGIVDLGASAAIGSGLRVDLEAARSTEDRNILSGRDDQDNAGTALRAAATLASHPLSFRGASLGTIRMNASTRVIEAEFTPFDRLDPVFDAERWNLASIGGGERRHEVSAEYAPTRSLAVRGDWGLRARSDGSASTRRAAHVGVQGAIRGGFGFEEAESRVEETRGRRSRWSLDLARDRGLVLPRLNVGEERTQGGEGDSVAVRRSRDVIVGFVASAGPAWRIRATRTERREDAAGGAAGAGSRTRSNLWDAGVAWRVGGALSVDASVASRRVRGATEATSDLGRLTLLAGPAGGPMTGELRYDATQLREPELRRELKPVGAGSGTYDAFGVPTFGGGHELLTTIGNPVPRSRAVLEMRLDAYPGRSFSASARRGPLRAWGSSSWLHVETDARGRLGLWGFGSRPDRAIDREATLRGSLAARQTIEFAPAGSAFDARAEVGVRRDRNREIADLISGVDARDARVRIRHPLPARMRAAWSLDGEDATRRVERTDTAAVSVGWTAVRGAELELSRPLGRAWTVAMTARGRRESDETNGGAQVFRGLGPVVRASLNGRLRIDARALWGETVERGRFAPAGRYLIPPAGSRIDYDLLGDYRLAERVSASLTWKGAKLAGQPASYTGRLEVRSTF